MGGDCSLYDECIQKQQAASIPGEEDVTIENIKVCNQHSIVRQGDDVPKLGESFKERVSQLRNAGIELDFVES
ncbi:MAG: hypothetical protein A2Z14_01940 [Chloroflexi bacterium RBG_16_48_8]|nr:MAG: hypothetical protein A2Z14_01940 [Chloroflexi bacterium RBG_16_48_8]